MVRNGKNPNDAISAYLTHAGSLSWWDKRHQLAFFEHNKFDVAHTANCSAFVIFFLYQI